MGVAAARMECGCRRTSLLLSCLSLCIALELQLSNCLDISGTKFERREASRIANKDMLRNSLQQKQLLVPQRRFQTIFYQFDMMSLTIFTHQS